VSLALSDKAALAGTINPSEAQITLPGAIKWGGWITGFPPHSGEMATLYGGLDKPGPYLVLMKWYPGYMSAPPTYATDRLSLWFSPARGEGTAAPTSIRITQFRFPGEDSSGASRGPHFMPSPPGFQ
jgi:hypothetical protein